ncbi:MAG: hypothetical protein ACHQUA_01920 [Microgenomates group bacterium]
MKSPLAQDTTKSAKSLAQSIAKQMAREPLEILKSVPRQVTGSENLSPIEDISGGTAPMSSQQKEIQDANEKMKSGRRMEALDRELKDISRERMFKELQKKISEGQDVYLEEYPELSMEQKQVLNAQIEAVKAQIAHQQNTQGGVIEPSSKKGRRMFNFGKKQQAQKQQTRVEKPMSPSG